MAQGVGWFIGWLPTWEATAELSGSCSLPGSSRNRCKEKTQPKHCAGAISVMISPLLWYASLVTKYIRNNSFLISFLVLHTIRFTPVQKRILTPSARERERERHGFGNGNPRALDFGPNDQPHDKPGWDEHPGLTCCESLQTFGLGCGRLLTFCPSTILSHFVHLGNVTLPGRLLPTVTRIQKRQKTELGYCFVPSHCQDFFCT